MRCSVLGYGSNSLLNEYFSKKRVNKIMEIVVADDEDARPIVTVVLRNF